MRLIRHTSRTVIGFFLGILLVGSLTWAEGPTYLRLPLQAPVPTLDPGLAQDAVSIEVIEQLFLGLTDYDPQTYEVVPELAKSWSSSKDGTVYTFVLREDVTWSDGTPVTAQDIEYALKRNIAPEMGSPYAYMLYVIVNAEAINKGELDPSKLGVKALDAKIIQFQLTTPANFFPALASLWVYRPLRRDVIEEHGPRWTDPDNIITNGSYRLTQWRKGDRLVLQENPTYTLGPVAIPAIHYYIVPESSTALAMYENDELDVLSNDYVSIPTPDLARIQADPVLSQEFSIQPSLCTYFIAFNNRKPPMNNPLVRKAITAAIDRQAIAERVLRNGWQPAQTFVAPKVFGNVADDSSIGIAFDPEQAKRWLAQAGYPDGEKFPDVIYMYNTAEHHAVIAQAIQASLRRHLGIDIKLANQEWKVFIQTRQSPDAPHMMRHAWCADYMDAHNWLYELFHPTNSRNEIQWDNREFAQVVEKAMVSQDTEERKELYKRAETILNSEETAIAPLFYYADPHLVKSRIKTWAKMPLGGNHLRDWKLLP